MDQPLEHHLAAFNTATASENKIHDDEVARRLGFTGGLVPGVDVFAYLCHLPVREWGTAWLERGAITADFHRPVYEGDAVTIRLATTDGQGAWQETLATPSTDRAASATTGPPSSHGEAALDVPRAELPADRPVASPESLQPGLVLGTLDVGFHADKAKAYLDDVRETLPVYRTEGVAHPGWLLRFANYVLAANVELGPWIHTSSRVCLHALVPDGARLECRARVAREYESKGHRLVDLDVLLVVDGDGPVMSVEHTAIYRPRQVS